MTVLDFACIGGWVECVVWLLEHCNANIEARNGFEWTPLNTAAINDHVDVYKVLLQRNADIEAA
jgi:ankyrin repeat protein